MDPTAVKQYFRDLSLIEARELYVYIGILLDIREDIEPKRKRRKDTGVPRSKVPDEQIKLVEGES